jgi:hypothetical protein
MVVYFAIAEAAATCAPLVAIWLKTRPLEFYYDAIERRH